MIDSLLYALTTAHPLLRLGASESSYDHSEEWQPIGRLHSLAFTSSFEDLGNDSEEDSEEQPGYQNDQDYALITI